MRTTSAIITMNKTKMKQYSKGKKQGYNNDRY